MIDMSSPKPRTVLISNDGTIVIEFVDGDTIRVETFWGEMVVSREFAA